MTVFISSSIMIKTGITWILTVYYLWISISYGNTPIPLSKILSCSRLGAVTVSIQKRDI